MQIKIFTIPIGMEESRIDELNHFLRANKVVGVRKEVVVNGSGGCWTFCITYLDGVKQAGNTEIKRSDKIDYRDVLGADEFRRFSDFRKIRKQLAEQEAVPAYAIFTDAELAEIAKLDQVTREHLIHFPGYECTAVCFDDPMVKGTGYEYEGRRFIICDPTYIGASIGMCMPDYLKERPQVELW